MADKILELLQDRDAARAMGERAARFVAQEFNLDLTVDRYVDLYSELLGGMSGGGRLQIEEKRLEAC
jgi:glycosyltransferase involved in cell wall biosynthesis